MVGQPFHWVVLLVEVFGPATCVGPFFCDTLKPLSSWAAVEPLVICPHPYTGATIEGTSLTVLLFLGRHPFE